jgi:hypothetical protein
MRVQKNGLVTRWSIPTARNILHSRTRLDDNKKMDKSVVGSSTHFFQNLFNEKNDDATLCGRYNYEKNSKQIKKAPGHNIFNLKNIYFIINIGIIIIGHALWFTWRKSGSSITILLIVLARMINI